MPLIAMGQGNPDERRFMPEPASGASWSGSIEGKERPKDGEYCRNLITILDDRFYLDQWRASVDQRLVQLDKFYSVVHTEVNERRMLWLEVIIVIFFALDLLILLWTKR
jgi:hypothetical protein